MMWELIGIVSFVIGIIVIGLFLLGVFEIIKTFFDNKEK
jgi:hypothetical protein